MGFFGIILSIHLSTAVRVGQKESVFASFRAESDTQLSLSSEEVPWGSLEIAFTPGSAQHFAHIASLGR